MEKKRYEVRGMMEWHHEFRVGRTRLQVSFTGGHLCGGASTPASYETSDPVVQKVIECSPAFRSGRIRMAHCCSIADPEASPVSAAMRNGSAAPFRIMEFTDVGRAADFLQEKKGIPVEHVLTREQCIAEARKLGIDMRIKEG